MSNDSVEDNSVDIAAIEKLLPELEKIHLKPEPEPNFFKIGSRGSYENPVSDVMQFFMETHSSHPAWLAKALFACLSEELSKKGKEAPVMTEEDWSNVTAEREVSIQGNKEGDGNKRLDIVITTNNFILGIENKVSANANNNPFEDYNNLLEERAKKNTLPIIKCITAPNSNVAGAPSDWPVISYDQIYNKGIEQWGKESVATPFSKWHIFYQEFLHHLNTLAHPELENRMTPEQSKFVEENYVTLKMARTIVNNYEEEFILNIEKKGKELISGISNITEFEIKIKRGTWWWDDDEGETKVVYFSPKHWGGNSKVVICFFYDENKKSISWFLRAYLFHDKSMHNAIIESFKTLIKEPSICTSIDVWDENGTWTEKDGRCLLFNYLPDTDTQEGALEALGRLAEWVNSELTKTVIS